jgi:Uma2 family endonuclease
VLFISKERLPKKGLTNRSLDVPPDLVAEVFSPSDRWREIHDKVNDYLATGVREVWVAHMKQRSMHVFRPDDAPVILSADAELTTDVLPGFRCRVSDIFAGL